MNKPEKDGFFAYLKNFLPASRQNLGSIKEEIETIKNELAVQKNDIFMLNYKFSEEDFALRKNILKQRILLSDHLDDKTICNEKVPMPNYNRMELSQCFEKLKKLTPRAFSIWEELLEVNRKACTGFPIHSCSVEGHPMAELFRCFLKLYLKGPVLDIGCGPQSIPSYLCDYPCESIAGIDPLSSPEQHSFVFVKGMAEFLPWTDKTFSVVVAATSLDHVLLLDQVLKEIHRVLREDGHFIVWASFIKGAEKYNPYDPEIKKVDDYHLFHFDKEWFEEILNKQFIVRECFSFMEPELSSFYSFNKR